MSLIPGRSSSSSGVKGPHAPEDDEDDQGSERLRGWSSTWDRVTYLLAQYRLPISLAVLAGLGLLLSGRGGLPQLPPGVRLALQGFAIGAVPAAVVGRLVIKRWFRDDRLRVLVLDPREGYFADVWKVPPRLWDHRDGGRYPPLPVNRGPIDYAVTRLAYVEADESEDEQDHLVVEGCNPEVANPIDVTATEGKLDEVYSRAQHVMADMSRFKGSWQVRANRMQAEDVTSLAAAMEHGTAFDPGAASETFEMDLWSDMGEDVTRDRTDDRLTLDELEQAVDKSLLRNDGGRPVEQGGETE